MTGRLAATFVLLLAAGAAAQAPVSAPAPPDTLVARFSWTGDGPAPRALTVAPVAAALGEAVILAVDLPADAADLPADSLLVDVDWLEPAPDLEVREPEGLPDATGRRLLIPLRNYRLGPWRVAWGDGDPGPVLAVAGRLESGAAPVPVRDPRRLGGLPQWVLLLAGALVLAALALFLWTRLHRRPGRMAAADRPLPPPAWLQVALDLWQLESERGHDRAYLDTLAAVLRRYLHARFHLPAEEMTAAEVGSAARRAGWPTARLGAFAGILAGCDQARYAPADVGARQCRDGTQRVLDLVDAERVDPVWTPVAPEQLAAATGAWNRLRERYPQRPEGGAAC